MGAMCTIACSDLGGEPPFCFYTSLPGPMGSWEGVLGDLGNAQKKTIDVSPECKNSLKFDLVDFFVLIFFAKTASFTDIVDIFAN